MGPFMLADGTCGSKKTHCNIQTKEEKGGTFVIELPRKYYNFVEALMYTLRSQMLRTLRGAKFIFHKPTFGYKVFVGTTLGKPIKHN